MESTRPQQLGNVEPAESTEGEAPSALSLNEVEAVLRRAVQIDARQRAPEGSALTLEDLTHIALEVGISPNAVQRALREHALGQLGSEERRGLLDRVFGGRSAAVARVAEMPPEQAKSELQGILRDEFLELVERRGQRMIWEPERGARASVLRAIRKVWTGRRDLRQIEIASEVRAADSSGQRALVSLDARLQGRSAYVALPVVTGTLTALGMLILAAIGFAELSQHAAAAGELFIATAMTAGGGAVVTAGFGALFARAWRERVRRARLCLEHLLDQLTGEAS